ncbi:MAG: hypothetical protein BGO01_16610 [Armatimonadetes bacterium 55-13]|nr:MAG: hypothetical protein BGO01_16610 [Armatimonadetes bacterium 55-13]
MTAKELLINQLEDAGYQLEKAYEGIDESTLDHRITKDAMTPRETLVHLSEAYYAVIEDAAGRQHEWGSYVAPDTSWPGLWKIASELRSKAVETTLSSPDGAMKAHAYIIAHDYYHVGQVCLARLGCNSEWNAYAIYKG